MQDILDLRMRGSCSQSKLALKILNFNRKNRQQQASQACVWVLYLIILLSIFQKMDLSSDDQTKMYFYENRLQTFVGWPFEEGCICTPENVSKPFGPSRWKHGFVGAEMQCFHLLYGFLCSIDGQSWIYSHPVGEQSRYSAVFLLSERAGRMGT